MSNDRYLCLSVPAEGRNTRNEFEQYEVHRVLQDLFDLAGSRAGVDRGRWQRHAWGGVEVALIPTQATPPGMVTEFCVALASALRGHNLLPGRHGRLRMRLAIDEGPVEMTANGFVGRPIVGATRLGGSHEARQALRDEPVADLVVVLSAGVHRDWVDAGRWARQEFRQVHILAEGVDNDAWLWMPGVVIRMPSGIHAADVPRQQGRTRVDDDDTHFGDTYN